MSNDVGYRPTLVWETQPAGTAVTALDFVREAGDDWLAVADQGNGLRLIRARRNPARTTTEVLSEDVRKFNYTDVAYGLAYVPQRTESPGLAAVGQQTLVYDSAGSLLFSEIENPDDMTALAVEALAGADGFTIIAVGGKDKDKDANVYLYSGDSGAKLQELSGGHRGAVRVVKAFRLERQLAVAHDGGITMWDLGKGAEQAHRIRTFGRVDNRSLAVFYDPQGRARLAAAGPHGIQIWDPTANGPDKPLSVFARNLNAAAIVSVTSEDGDPQLAVAHGREVSLWSTSTERLGRELAKAHEGQVKRLAKILTGDGSTLLAAADDKGRVVVWELPRVRSTTRQYGRHTRWVNALVTIQTTDSVELVSASDDRTVQLWNPEHGSPSPREMHSASVQALAVADGQDEATDLLVSGDEAGHIRLSRLRGDKDLGEENTEGKVRALAIFADGAGGHRVVAAGADARITVWDPDKPTGQRSVVSPFEYRAASKKPLIRVLAVNESEGLLAAGDSDGRVTVWETTTGRLRWTDAVHHNGQVRALAWIPTASGSRLASGGGDGKIYLWSPEQSDTDEEQPRTVSEPFTGHSGPVAALAPLSISGEMIQTSAGEVHLFVSGGADGTIRTWDPEDWTKAYHVLRPAHPSWVRALVRLEYGGALHVVSGGDDGTIRQWVVEDGKLRSTYHGIKLHGFGDRPAKVDLLDRNCLRGEIVRLLRLAQPVGDKREEDGLRPHTSGETTDMAVLTTGPRVVAIQGAWGAGKTSLMRMIFRELSKDNSIYTEPDGSPPTPPSPTDVARVSLGWRQRVSLGWRRWGFVRWWLKRTSEHFTPAEAYRLTRSRSRRNAT